FSVYAGCELLTAIVWVTTGLMQRRSMWTWLFLSEAALVMLRVTGCLMIAFWTDPDWYVFPSLIEMGSQLLWVSQAGGLAVGAIAIVIALIDGRQHHRDWLHLLAVALLAMRPVTALLEYLAVLWR